MFSAFHTHAVRGSVFLQTNAWQKLDMLGKAPSARSGHRMVVWRNQLVLFGGFYDSLRDTKWFNDLYVMGFQDLK